MVILRKYQLDIIFLFFGISGILWSVFSLLTYWGADPHGYEWYVSIPFLILYVVELWKIRQKINQHDVRVLSGKTLVYWIALGILMFASYATPLPATNYWSLEAVFILFTLFLADSYWDFRTLTWKGMFSKKELGK